MKVLHIVESFHTQAIESWLLQVLHRAREKHPHLEWTFFCIVGQPGAMDEAVRKAGGRIIHSAHEVRSKKAFLSSLRATLRSERPDVLHCHHDIMSALPLLASVGLPIRRRIVHVHNTSIDLPTSNLFKQALMRPPLQRICMGADRIVGVSRDALDAMLVGSPRRAERDTVVHCGIETEQFQHDPREAAQLREAFGFGADARILLFVGRMIAYKNPLFVIEMLHHLHQRDPRFAAVFAGAGAQEEEVREMARHKYLQERVRVLGWRSDVARLMGACDILIWPGLEKPKEGLGLGVVEAQAAGLPVLMSRNVPEEAIVVRQVVKILPLTAGPQAWAEAAQALLQNSRPSRLEALSQVAASSFSIEQSTDSIVALYAGLVHSRKYPLL